MTIEKVKTELTDTKIKKQKAEKEKNFLLQYFLQTYLYSGNEDILSREYSGKFQLGSVALCHFDRVRQLLF